MDSSTIQNLHCIANEVGQSVDLHPGLWAAALIIVSLFVIIVEKVFGKKTAAVIGTIVVVLGGIGAVVILVMPPPSYCKVYSGADSQRFSMDHPGFLAPIPSNQDAMVFTYGNNSGLKIWPGNTPVDNGWRYFLEEHKRLRAEADTNVAPWATIDKNSNITREDPYFELSYQTRDHTFVYEVMCYERVDRGRPDIVGVDGKAHVRRFQVVAPVHNSPYTDDNYERMLSSFLANCHLSPTHAGVWQDRGK